VFDAAAAEVAQQLGDVFIGQGAASLQLNKLSCCLPFLRVLRFFAAISLS
jgi:hypothetical protein